MWVLFSSWIAPALIGAASAIATWIALDFVRTPLREFFNIRLRAFRAANEYARFVAGSPETPALWMAMDAGGRDRAKEAFAAIGHDLLAFGSNEWAATRILKLAGYDPSLSGEKFLRLADEIDARGTSAPTRQDVLDPLGMQ